MMEVVIAVFLANVLLLFFFVGYAIGKKERSEK